MDEISGHGFQLVTDQEFYYLKNKFEIKKMEIYNSSAKNSKIYEEISCNEEILSFSIDPTRNNMLITTLLDNVCTTDKKVCKVKLMDFEAST